MGSLNIIVTWGEGGEKQVLPTPAFRGHGRTCATSSSCFLFSAARSAGEELKMKGKGKKEKRETLSRPSLGVFLRVATCQNKVPCLFNLLLLRYVLRQVAPATR